MIPQLARLDQMCSQEDRSEQDANAADNEVCDTQKGVFAAHDGARGDEDGFCAAVFVDGVACGGVSGDEMGGEGRGGVGREERWENVRS